VPTLFVHDFVCISETGAGTGAPPLQENETALASRGSSVIQRMCKPRLASAILRQQVRSGGWGLQSCRIRARWRFCTWRFAMRMWRLSWAKLLTVGMSVWH